ncbi:Bug family tripartite tricarboxylate transporter substrate binding protein [Phyllobacterium phragmitis]|nr:tripartite tricarboxylate transporter substrate binding protein [Phyllobacterium phragmitis]
MLGKRDDDPNLLNVHDTPLLISISYWNIASSFQYLFQDDLCWRKRRGKSCREECMTMSIKHLLIGCVAAVQILGITETTLAQDSWPSQPVHLVVPYPPGGNTDLIARTVSASLSEILGQPVVVENKAGAGGTVGMGAVAGAAPDGYMLVVGDIATMGINPHVYKNLKYDPATDFDPIIQITSVPLVLGVGPKLGFDDLDSFLKAAKADPELVDYASAGVGTAQHLAFEYFKSLTGIDAVHIPYKGSGPARTALIAGEVGAMIDGTLIPSVLDKSITALAVTSEDRVSVLPDVPTLKEKGVDMVYTSWHGIFAPKGTDPAVIEKLNVAINKILQQPDVIKRFSALNINLVGGSPKDFNDFVAGQSERLGELVKLSDATGQ